MHDIFLGGLQGLTEFLPISSSGHLGLAYHLLGLDTDILARTVLFHVGTLFACCTFFFKDIGAYVRQRRMLGYILTVTLITAVFGILFKRFLEPLFGSTSWIGALLLVNGLLLLATRRSGSGRRRITLLDSVLMGLVQGIAILPGISRSGITITALLLRGCDRQEAFRFSFIASLPAVAAAFILEWAIADSKPLLKDPSIYLGMATAFLLGLMALYMLKGLLILKKFYLFGFYCLALGALVLLTLR